MGGAFGGEFREVGPQDGPGGTRMESLEEIRQAAQARRTPTVKEGSAEQDTVAFRPVHRPPMAVLCILDDGREEGEWLRIRKDRIQIGRAEGDIIIAHDAMMSGRHAEIVRQSVQGGFRWYLNDLSSTNGTYVRATAAILNHGQEFLLGSRRYRFHAAQGGAQATETAADETKPGATRGWQAVSQEDILPSLLEITPQGEGRRLFLTRPDNWLGRSADQSTLVPADDPMVSPRHARLHRDSQGRWHLENAGSRNGVWVRVQRMPLHGSGQFQLGEQRFLIRIL